MDIEKIGNTLIKLNELVSNIDVDDIISPLIRIKKMDDDRVYDYHLVCYGSDGIYLKLDIISSDGVEQGMYAPFTSSSSASSTLEYLYINDMNSILNERTSKFIDDTIDAIRKSVDGYLSLLDKLEYIF